jgi:pimeloyl-ACP methyl ester carboxylesterase
MYRWALQWLLALALLISPFAPRITQASAEEPFVFQSVIGPDGKLEVEFVYLADLAPTERVELLIGEKDSKEVLRQKITKRGQAVKVKGVTHDQPYVFNLKVTDVKKGKTSKVTQASYEETASYAGELVVRVKQDGSGRFLSSHVQMGAVAEHRSFGITEGEMSAFLVTYEAESNDSYATANTLIPGDDLYGKIGASGDVDFYKISFGTSGVAHFWLGGIPSNTDYDLYVYDQNFNQIAYSIRGSNYDEVITGKAVAAGQTYYVKVIGYNGTFDSNNYYDLRVTNSASPAFNADAYEINDTFEGATSVGNTMTVYGNLHTATDVDYYRIHVPLRSSFTLGLSAIPSGTDYDVAVYDGGQNRIGSSVKASNASESIQLTLNPGDYYIKVYPYSGSSDLKYRLDVTTNTIPVILVPGIGGSQLMANGDLTWFNIWDALLINQPLRYNLPLKPACEGCTGVVQKNSDVTITVNDNNYGLEGIAFLTQYELGVASYYNNFINDLKRAGYVPGKTLFGFPYDWRLDNRAHQALFTNKVNAALSASGASKVQVVAHSMGGLVVKDYLLQNPGMAGKFDQVITAGTPFLGAAKATKALAFGGDNFGVPILMESTGEMVAEHSPAVYQLAPSQEYENQVRARYGRATYRYVDLFGQTTDYTHAQLNAKYPNQALAGLADTRHSEWDFSYAGVKQYHLVGDTVDTITAYNYWVMKDVFHWFHLEYVMAKGDGTVPLLSAEKPGSASAVIFYTNDDHGGLVKSQSARTKLLNLLKGDPNAPVSGVRTEADTDMMGALTSNSLTADAASFQNMTVEVHNLKTGETGYVRFRSDGTLDQENSTASLMPQIAKLEDGTYNLQFFLNKYDDSQVVVKSVDGTEFITVTYDLTDSGAENRFYYGKLKNSAIAPITFTKQGGVTSVSQGGTTIRGQSFHMQ